MYKIGFIGAGNMAFALAKAIKQAKLAKSIIASDTKEERLEFVKRELKIKVSAAGMRIRPLTLLRIVSALKRAIKIVHFMLNFFSITNIKKNRLIMVRGTTSVSFVIVDELTT